MIRLEKNVEDKIIDLLDRGEYKISYHRSIHSWDNHFIVDVGCIRYTFDINSASTPYMSSRLN